MEDRKPLDLSTMPMAWRRVLAAVQQSYPSAVIAGGCLRDKDLGVRPKDIDIFIEVPNGRGRKPSEFNDEMAAAGWPTEIAYAESYENKRGLLAVLRTTFPGCSPIELIFMEKVELAEFDFGICQIKFDGQTVTRTADYHRDKRARVFRLVPDVSDESFLRSINRWASLKERYPEWRFELGSRASSRSPEVGLLLRPQGEAIIPLTHTLVRGVLDYPFKA